MSRSQRPSSKTEVHLAVEALDPREAPSALFGSAFFSSSWTPAAIEEQAAAAANQSPVVSDFRAIVGADGQITFTGKVTDDHAVEGTVVRITGQGVDVTAIVLKDGTFSVTTIVSGGGDITVTATATDADGATSNPAYTVFSPSN